jgi:hypothetical protein
MISKKRQGIDSALDQSGWADPLLFMFYSVLDTKIPSEVEKILYLNPIGIFYTERADAQFWIPRDVKYSDLAGTKRPSCIMSMNN